MLRTEYTHQFKKDFKLMKRRGKEMTLLQEVMKKIEKQEKLDKKHKDHPLIGDWQLHRELHVENDWLLVYLIISDEKTVVFVRTGTHSDLF